MMKSKLYGQSIAKRIQQLQTSLTTKAKGTLQKKKKKKNTIEEKDPQKQTPGSSLVVQLLRLQTPNSGAPELISDRELNLPCHN